MRRKTIAKRVIDREYEDEQEEDQKRDIDERKSQNEAFELDGPGVERLVDGESAPQEVDCLQSRSKAELVAMVLCMQKEMESLREQIQCLTACGKLARTLEALVERTQLWSDGDCRTPSPSMPGVLVGGDELAPAVLNRQWAKQDGPSPNTQPEPRKDPQKNGHHVFQEFITAALLDRCNTGSTAQKLTNDLLRGLYQRDCLASCSVSGVVCSGRGQPKPALPAHEVHAILRAVQHYFPGKTDAQIKGYIRQKLQNEAKRLRKKPRLLMKTWEGPTAEEAGPVPPSDLSPHRLTDGLRAAVKR